ncbi:hypothetical protein FCI23_01685 [Actinacidiphila oryziradicis]|uniref:Uncharacterized protein n=1 Tax=Actinacidiphila oryziradicis TaxID=2571141 RepID=A0A4V5N0U4_9ACTN|nr:hypothetical protein FCI23_01685 [Actinacidiphila oryziradicis]
MHEIETGYVPALVPEPTTADPCSPPSAAGASATSVTNAVEITVPVLAVPHDRVRISRSPPGRIWVGLTVTGSPPAPAAAAAAGPAVPPSAISTAVAVAATAEAAAGGSRLTEPMM